MSTFFFIHASSVFISNLNTATLFMLESVKLVLPASVASITPDLKSLQWLLEQIRIQFLLFVFHSANSLAYVCELLSFHHPSRPWCSAILHLLRSHGRGTNSGSLIMSTQWSVLNSGTLFPLRNIPRLFKAKLKTHLLRISARSFTIFHFHLYVYLINI